MFQSTLKTGVVSGKIWQNFSGWYHVHIISNLEYFTLTLQDLPPGRQIYGLSGVLARHANADFIIEPRTLGTAAEFLGLRTLGTAAEFLKFLLKKDFVASGSCYRACVGFNNQEGKRSGLDNTKTENMWNKDKEGAWCKCLVKVDYGIKRSQLSV